MSGASSSPPDADGEIQRADPRARRKALVIVALTTCLGLALVPLVNGYFQALSGIAGGEPRDAVRALTTALAAVGGMGVALALGAAAWLARLCNRIRAEERFPPRGVAVLRDTPVLRGGAARRRAFTGFVLAGFLALSGVGLALVLWRLVAHLTRLSGA